jgi:hypothetical protein
MPTLPAASSTASVTTPNRPANPAWEIGFDRWVDLNYFNYGARYRSTFDSNGARSFDQGQQRLLLDGKFKFDEEGRYGIGFHLSSGRYFNWAYANFIGGGQGQFIINTEARMTPFQLYIMSALPFENGFFKSGGSDLYFRQAFLTAQPIRGIEAQFGGIGIERGVNTEATSYDDDGYMAGERLIVKRPKQIWLSELSYTRAYIGDLYTPNFFGRGQRLAISNYWQILGRKDFGKRIAASADYTYSVPEDNFPTVAPPYFLKTTREAVFADIHESKVLDKVRFEAYQRLNSGQYAAQFPFPDGKGWALTLSGHVTKKFSIEGGVAHIDINYISNIGLNAQAMILGLTMNGDQYGVGKRFFLRPTIPLTHSVSLVGNYSRVFDTNLESSGGTDDLWNSRALAAGFTVDAKKLFFHSPAVH